MEHGGLEGRRQTREKQTLSEKLLFRLMGAHRKKLLEQHWLDRSIESVMCSWSLTSLKE